MIIQVRLTDDELQALIDTVNEIAWIPDKRYECMIAALDKLVTAKWRATHVCLQSHQRKKVRRG